MVTAMVVATVTVVVTVMAVIMDTIQTIVLKNMLVPENRLWEESWVRNNKVYTFKKGIKYATY